MKTYIGLDAGHNNLKLVGVDESDSKIFKSLMPSYILSDRDLFRNTHPNSPGLVYYLAGQRVDLINKCWLMGESAVAANEWASVPLASVDGGKGKVDYALHSLLSLLSKLPHRSEWDISLVCSNHRADVYAELVREKINGEHQVLLAGQRSVVRVNVEKVVNEATHYKPKVGKETALIDFGGGTTILIKYGADGRNADREVIDIGVDQLINLIYDHEMTYSLLHKDRSRHLIRLGIEAYSQSKDKPKNPNGSPIIWYGIKGKGGKEISLPYFACLNTWLRTYMKSILKNARTALRSGASLELIGGGAMLPGLEDILFTIFNAGDEIHTINKVSPAALWINSLALLEMAKPKPEVKTSANTSVFNKIETEVAA
ncbi:MAG: hypothetical protein V7L23_15460 [Nostoc sp.]|uniref:hypothetical protein n=1 Tax=Nostoc sp. TaxID=1180 RepID=UPI002FF1699B